MNKEFAVNNKRYRYTDPVFECDFTSPEEIWIEGGRDVGEIRDGMLILDADSETADGGTVFIDRKFSGDLYFEYRVTVLSSSSAHTDNPDMDYSEADNINTFLYYSSPDGIDLKESADQRMDGAYTKYHNLNGFIVTHLNGYLDERMKEIYNPSYHTDISPGTARTRMRECPGFILKEENYKGEIATGTEYRMQFLYVTGRLRFTGMISLQLNSKCPKTRSAAKVISGSAHGKQNSGYRTLPLSA